MSSFLPGIYPYVEWVHVWLPWCIHILQMNRDAFLAMELSLKKWKTCRNNWWFVLGELSLITYCRSHTIFYKLQKYINIKRSKIHNCSVNGHCSLFSTSKITCNWQDIPNTTCICMWIYFDNKRQIIYCD